MKLILPKIDSHNGRCDLNCRSEFEVPAFRLLNYKRHIEFLFVFSFLSFSSLVCGEAKREPVFMNYKTPNQAEIKSKLSDIQYRVTQLDETEPPFQNEYWNHHEVGIYVDIVTGEPLFLSKDKFDSGTGWPSFTRPIFEESIVEKKDTNWGMTRVEVRSKIANSHLGHVFDDGPRPTGLRYCINSAALRFIKKEDLTKYGYADLLPLVVK